MLLLLLRTLVVDRYVSVLTDNTFTCWRSRLQS